MTRVRLLQLGAVALGLFPTSVFAQPSPDPPPVPPAIEAPAGHTAFLSGHAIGTQNYVCAATASGAAWRLQGPQATLYTTFKDQIRQQIITHYLSVNPAEASQARPTWQHSFDSSRVWGRVLASSADSAYVEPGAVPWLLVEAAGTQVGPTGGPILAQTTFIQRLNTSGGQAPQSGCSQPGDLGSLALVPYSADYYFFRADR